MTSPRLTGGCQCGAVRFACSDLGRASICHCRMCQKAFGGFFGPLVTARDLVWTRGAPKRFRSSNRVARGFCGDCGTPLTFEPDGGEVDVAIGAFDDPAAVPPTVQVGAEFRLPFVDHLAELPHRPAAELPGAEAWYGSIVTHQHPDHDTDTRPEERP